MQQHSVSTNIYGTLAYRSLQDFKKKIFPDEEVFEQIKPASRKAYKKCWKEFKEINPMINFEEGPPGEEAIVIFFKHLRLYAMAGIELVPVLVPVPVQERIESTIRQAMSSVPTVNLKIVVLNEKIKI